MPKIIEIEQNTEMWLAWRAKGLGGSDMDTVLNGSELEKKHLMYRILTGEKMHFAEHIQKAMQRGHEMEPIARHLAERATAAQFKAVCIESDFDPRFRVSLDGLSRNGRIVLEVKALAATTHLGTLKKYRETGSALASLSPRYYTQIQYQLMVAEADFALYAGYNPDAPTDQFYLIPVEHDRVFQANIWSAAKAFFNELDKAKGYPNIISVTGFGQQGKDSVADYLWKSKYGYLRLGHADQLKSEMQDRGILPVLLNDESKIANRDKIVDYSVAQKAAYGEDVWSERMLSRMKLMYAMWKESEKRKEPFQIVVPDARYLSEIINLRYFAQKNDLTFAAWGVNRDGVSKHVEEATSVPYALDRCSVIFDNSQDFQHLYDQIDKEMIQYGR